VAGLYREAIPWASQALCATMNADAWFPPKSGTNNPAKRVCNGDKGLPACPVRDECLDYALRYREPFGVWGGMTEKERRVLLGIRR
jgi:WhiB family redox-sensing transcriptional regulator